MLICPYTLKTKLIQGKDNTVGDQLLQISPTPVSLAPSQIVYRTIPHRRTLSLTTWLHPGKGGKGLHVANYAWMTTSTNFTF